MGVDGGNIDTIRLTWTRGDSLILDENIRQSLVSIRTAFDNSNCNMDAIRIRNNNISFDTINGQYFLVYTIDDKRPAKVDANTKQRCKIKKTEDNWYHKIAKRW